MPGVHEQLRKYWKKSLVLFVLGLGVSFLINSNLHNLKFTDGVFLSDLFFICAMVFVVFASTELASNMGFFNNMKFGTKHLYRLVRNKPAPSEQVKEEYVDYVRTRTKYGDVPFLFVAGLCLLGISLGFAAKGGSTQKSKELEAFYQREKLSGAHWAEKYPWSRSTADLKSPFREQTIDFIAALKDAGATVVIENTLRPQNMAFLMCYSWRIIKGKISPLKVPANRDLDIIWAHTNSKGEYDEAASIAGALELAKAYGIQNNPVSPALNSNHITGLAIDMLIRWDDWPDGTTKQIKNKQGQLVTVQKDVNGTGMPGTRFYEADFNRQIIAIGATYGVIAYNPPEQDKGHWSYNGK